MFQVTEITVYEVVKVLWGNRVVALVYKKNDGAFESANLEYEETIDMVFDRYQLTLASDKDANNEDTIAFGRDNKIFFKSLQVDLNSGNLIEIDNYNEIRNGPADRRWISLEKETILKTTDITSGRVPSYVEKEKLSGQMIEEPITQSLRRKRKKNYSAIQVATSACNNYILCSRIAYDEERRYQYSLFCVKVNHNQLQNLEVLDPKAEVQLKFKKLLLSTKPSEDDIVLHDLLRKESNVYVYVENNKYFFEDMIILMKSTPPLLDFWICNDIENKQKNKTKFPNLPIVYLFTMMDETVISHITLFSSSKKTKKNDNLSIKEKLIDNLTEEEQLLLERYRSRLTQEEIDEVTVNTLLKQPSKNRLLKEIKKLNVNMNHVNRILSLYDLPANIEGKMEIYDLIMENFEDRSTIITKLKELGENEKGITKKTKEKSVQFNLKNNEIQAVFSKDTFPDNPIIINAAKIDRQETLNKLNQLGNDNQILIDNDFACIRKNNLMCIVPIGNESGWLNDEVINIYMWMLSERDKKLSSTKESSRIGSYFYNSCFMKTLTEEGYTRVSRY